MCFIDCYNIEYIPPGGHIQIILCDNLYSRAFYYIMFSRGYVSRHEHTTQRRWSPYGVAHRRLQCVPQESAKSKEKAVIDNDGE